MRDPSRTRVDAGTAIAVGRPGRRRRRGPVVRPPARGLGPRTAYDDDDRRRRAGREGPAPDGHDHRHDDPAHQERAQPRGAGPPAPRTRRPPQQAGQRGRPSRRSAASPTRELTTARRRAERRPGAAEPLRDGRRLLRPAGPQGRWCARRRPATPPGGPRRGAPAPLPGHRPGQLPPVRHAARTSCRTGALPLGRQRPSQRRPRTCHGPHGRATASRSRSPSGTALTRTAGGTRSRSRATRVPAPPHQRLRGVARDRRPTSAVARSPASPASRRCAGTSTRTPTAWPSSSSAASAHCGRPWSPYGVTFALVDCQDHTAHQRQGRGARGRAVRRARRTTRSAGRRSRTGRRRTR